MWVCICFLGGCGTGLERVCIGEWAYVNSTVMLICAGFASPIFDGLIWFWDRAEMLYDDGENEIVVYS